MIIFCVTDVNQFAQFFNFNILVSPTLITASDTTNNFCVSYIECPFIANMIISIRNISKYYEIFEVRKRFKL